MLDLSLFRIKVFSLGVSARFLSFLGGSAVFFLMPFYLIHGLGYAASEAALIMVPGAIFMAVMGPISGRISDKIGTRWSSVMGMGLSTVAMFIFAMLTVDSPAIHVVLGMVLSGAGMGAFSATNSSAIMGSLRGQRIGIVSAFIGLTRTSANVTGIALATTMVSITMASLGYEPSLAEVGEAGGEGLKAAFVSGMSRAFLVSASLSLLALVLTGLRGEVQPAHRPAPGPAPESASSPSSTTEE